MFNDPNNDAYTDDYVPKDDNKRCSSNTNSNNSNHSNGQDHQQQSASGKPEDFTLNSGKNKGKILGELLSTDHSYLEWAASDKNTYNDDNLHYYSALCFYNADKSFNRFKYLNDFLRNAHYHKDETLKNMISSRV